MILWTFKTEPETRGDHMPCDAFRWTLQATYRSIGFIHQARSRRTGEWMDSHTTVYEVSLERQWVKPQFEHYYYDGPHCFFHVGFLRIQYNGARWCKRCTSDIND